MVVGTQILFSTSKVGCMYCGIIVVRGGSMFVAFMGYP